MSEYETGESGYRYHDQTVTVNHRYQNATTVVGDVAYLIGRIIRLALILATLAILYVWQAPAGLKATCLELVNLIGASL